jgi:hypothetical protein
MKKLLCITIFALVSAAAGQTVKARVARFENAKYYAVNYSAFSKTTQILSPPGDTSWSTPEQRRSFSEWMEMNFPGTEPNGNATLDLILESDSFTEYYKTDHRLTLVVDGKAVDIGSGSRATRKSMMFDFVEIMTYRLTAEQMASLAKAKTVTMRIEKFEGSLDEPTVATFRNMISLMN